MENLWVEVQFSSVVQSCPTFCDPIDCSMPGFPAHHQLRVYSNLCPLSQWCHPTNSFSVAPFSSHLQSFPALGSFQISQFFASGGQNTSFSFSISPSNEYSGLISFTIDWLDSLQSKGFSRVFSNTTVQKYQFFGTQLSLWSSSHIHTRLLEKTIALTRQTFVGKAMSLLFNMLSRFIIAFLPRNKHLLISWLQSPSVVILEPNKIKANLDRDTMKMIGHEIVGIPSLTDAKTLMLF